VPPRGWAGEGSPVGRNENRDSDLWKGDITNWQFDSGAEFRVTARGRPLRTEPPISTGETRNEQSTLSASLFMAVQSAPPSEALRLARSVAATALRAQRVPSWSFRTLAYSGSARRG
jgi:hypothetical protein